jgi:hypothetical protein
MIHYSPQAGENISETAKIMVELLKGTTQNQKVAVKFNDITLTADANSTVEGIIRDFRTKLAAAAEAYRDSPEGKRAQLESEQRKEKAQCKHDTLMQQLPNLDFTNLVAVLDWLCEFQDPSDYIGVVKRQSEVLAIFAKHGYQPNVNTGKKYNDDDRDNVARYIIGQALSNLKSDVGAIHQVIHHFTREWKRKFAV